MYAFYCDTMIVGQSVRIGTARKAPNALSCMLYPTPLIYASPAGVRWGNHHVLRVRGLSPALHVDTYLDVVGPPPSAALHGVHRHRDEVNRVGFIRLALSWLGLNRLGLAWLGLDFHDVI